MRTVANSNVVHSLQVRKANAKPAANDGINLEIEGLDGIEELDYVDDVLDGDDLEIAEFAGELESQERNVVIGVQPLLRDTTGNGIPPPAEKSLLVQVSTDKPLPSTSTGQSGVAKVVEMRSGIVPVTEHISDEELANMPRVKNLFNKFWAEKMQDLKKGEKDGKNFIKSPSDTTFYAPALNKSPLNPHCTVNKHCTNGLVDTIVSNFVDNVRIEQRQEELQSLQEKERRKSANYNQEFEDARTRMDRMVLEAEKFRASVVEPDPGMKINKLFGDSQMRTQTQTVQNVQSVIVPTAQNVQSVSGQEAIPNIGSGVSDDDFFHLTCHIEPNLFHKIEKGEFVELEKLLPKDKIGGNRDENRLEWIQRDGGTFLVPAHRDSKISSFRRWEQAFRAYATIYCGANPHRSREIWQYITVINTAASAFQWDNVYNYDITFRHLMAFNPQRSWAVTYNQMWNLSMKDPLPRNYSNQKTGYAQSFNHNQNKNNNSGAAGKKKSDYCWNFNKGIPCKFGAKCKFLERCKYCDSPSHGVNNCFRLQKKNENKPIQETKSGGGSKN